jgi:hypothetical protein
LGFFLSDTLLVKKFPNYKRARWNTTCLALNTYTQVFSAIITSLRQIACVSPALI